MMKFISALFSHFALVLRLKHDGRGMPVHMPAAMALISIYALLGLINYSYEGNINYTALFGLCFVMQCYLFFLRNKLIGLIIVISILINAVTMVLDILVGISEQSIFVLNIMEYIMIFSAIINVIKSETVAH
jgi:O-antigen ligase